MMIAVEDGILEKPPQLGRGRAASPVLTSRLLRRVGRAATAASGSPQAYLYAANEAEDRAHEILREIKASIPEVRASVESDIAAANRDRAILGMANFFGMLFGFAGATGGNPRLGELRTGDQIQFIAEALYGYGYWGPFLLEFEDARLDCGNEDLEQVLAEYSFLLDMENTYSYLDTYNPYSTYVSSRYRLTDVTDPNVLQFYAVELNHAMKRSLFCITSRKSSNQDALDLNTLIDIYTKLLSERLAMTNEAMNHYDQQHSGYNTV